MLWLTLLTAVLLNPLLPYEARISEYPKWVLERMPPNGRAGVTEAVFDGRPTVIAAFATWCAPCIKEIPALNRLHREYPELRVVGISADNGPPAKVRGWLNQHNVQYPVFLPDPMVLAGTSRIGSVDDLPLLAFFQANGNLARRLVGTVPERLITRCMTEIGIRLHHTP